MLVKKKRFVLVSAKHEHESARGIHMSSPSRMSLPPSLVWRNINLKGKRKSENIVHHFLVLFLSNCMDQWWKMKWRPTPVLLPRESHEQRSLVVYSPQVSKSQTQLATEHIHTNQWSEQMGILGIVYESSN